MTTYAKVGTRLLDKNGVELCVGDNTAHGMIVEQEGEFYLERVHYHGGLRLEPLKECLNYEGLIALDASFPRLRDII